MKITNALKICTGFIALALGTIGLVIPVWPTTPFVILAIGCFSSMPTLQRRILRIRLFREYYEGYTTGCGLQRKTVVFSLVFLWTMIILSSVLSNSSLIVTFLLMVGIAVSIHILWMAKGKKRAVIS